MNTKLLAFPLLAIFIALPACDDDTTAMADGGVSDTSITEAGAANALDLVVNKYMLPVTDAEAKKYAYDIDSDGKVDNALGAILAAIKAIVPSVDMQKDMDQNVQNGRVIMLMRVKAADLTTASTASLQAWTGEEKVCCDNKPCSVADAKQKCFSGTNEHKPDVNSPANAVLSGAIAAGTGTFGPGTVEIQLPIGRWAARVKLLKAKVEGQVSSTGLIEGKLAGAIGQSDLKSQVIPAVAMVLDAVLTETTSSQASKDAIKKAFDANKDGKITNDEVEGNAAVAAVMSGDVDADGDGKKEELSAAVGFTAVTATLKIN